MKRFIFRFQFYMRLLGDALLLIKQERAFKNAIQWASRKRIKRMQTIYQDHLHRVEQDLSIYVANHPTLLEIAYWIDAFCNACYPERLDVFPKKL